MILGQLSARPQTVFLEDCEAREGLADPEVFRESSTFLPTFYQVVSDLLAGKHSHVPVVMAARLSEQAYLDFDVQIRLLKRIMALEALFSSGSTFGKRALIPRVQKFLGEATPIYPGTKARYTVATVIEDLCELRNAFAHGEVVPQRFLDTPPEPVVASTNVRTYADILREASAVVLRACLLRIFREGLIETFSDKAKMEALF